MSIIINPAEFKYKLLLALRDEIDKALSRNIYGVEAAIKITVDGALRSSPEVLSMLYGTLRFDFGFEKGQEAAYVEPIIDFIVKNIRVDYGGTSVGTGLDVNYKVNLLTFDPTPLYKMGRYDSKGGPVEWMEWLLSKGTQPIIRDYQIQYLADAPKSRSGFAYMRKGKGYFIPSEFAGVPDNNFITRSFEAVADQIEKIVSNAALAR